MNGELGLACLVVQCNLHCGVMNDVYTRVVRLLSPVHFWLCFSCQNYNRTIVCSTTILCKALAEIILFRNKSLASALCACFSVQHKSLCGLKNDVQYTHVTCACCEQCTLLCGFFRKIQLLLWPTQLAVVAPKFNDAFSDVDHSGLTL